MLQLKLITLLGPTSSGKSAAGVELAKHLGNAVIIGCDSRQLYKDCNLGTGKVEGTWVDTTKKFKEFSQQFSSIYCYQDIPHFLIDTLEVGTEYSVKEYVSDFDVVVKKLSTVSTIKYIILVGGTGYYAQAVLEGWKFDHQVQVNIQDLNEWQLRSQYYHSVLTNQSRLLNNSDLYNPRRLVSYFNPELPKMGLNPLLFNSGVFALTRSKEHLTLAITNRLEDRIDLGMFEEFYDLYHKYGRIVITKAIEYQCLEHYLLGWVSLEICKKNIINKTLNYIKRQMTWLTQSPNLVFVDSYLTILSAINVTPSEIIDGLNTTIHNNVTDKI